MSYTPGTRLMSGNGVEHATVLSDGMVMADAYENGWRWRSMMKLEDWLLISGDVKVINEAPFVPVGYMPAAAPVQQESVPEPAPLPQRPVGTKLRWVLHADTYRIAIATANGILQVKAVNDRVSDCLPNETTRSWQLAKLKKAMFATEEEWRASLPNGGQVTIVELQQKNMPLVMAAASDVEKVEQLSARFKVRAGVHEEPSPLIQRENFEHTINTYTRIIANSHPTADGSEYGQKVFDSFKRSIVSFKKKIQEIDAMSEAEKNRQEFHVGKYMQSKQKLLVTLANGISTQISPSSKIQGAYRGGQPIPHGIFCHHDRKVYSSLDEMNVFKRNGCPLIEASYRRKMIDLSHLFAPQALA